MLSKTRSINKRKDGKKPMGDGHTYLCIPTTAFLVLRKLADQNYRSLGAQLAAMLVEHGYAKSSEIAGKQQQETIEQDNGKFSNK